MLAEELMSLARVQFIITLVIFLFCMIFLPRLGFGGMTMRIYPCLTAGYFILFLMYAEIIFLYYDDRSVILPFHYDRQHHFHAFFGNLVWNWSGGWLLCRMERCLCEDPKYGKKSGYSYFLQWTFVEENQRYLPVAESI